jgi:hypothetical protein
MPVQDSSAFGNSNVYYYGIFSYSSLILDPRIIIYYISYYYSHLAT